MTRYAHRIGDFRLKLKWEEGCILNSLQAENSDSTPIPLLWCALERNFGMSLCSLVISLPVLSLGAYHSCPFLNISLKKKWSFTSLNFCDSNHVAMVGFLMSGIKFCVLLDADCHRPHLLLMLLVTESFSEVHLLVKRLRQIILKLSIRTQNLESWFVGWTI